MPAWLQQILVALGAFIGGRVVTTVGDRMKESKELRRSVDRLALAVEQVPVQISSLQGEIHRVGARNEAQLQSLRDELHDHKLEQERRFGTIELRIDKLAVPPPPPAPTPAQFVAVEPRLVAARLRLDQERRCYTPEPDPGLD